MTDRKHGDIIPAATDANDAPAIAGGARHEIRNQLNTILMNAELIALLARRHESPQMLEPAQRIVDACRQCSEVLER